LKKVTDKAVGMSDGKAAQYENKSLKTDKIAKMLHLHQGT